MLKSIERKLHYFQLLPKYAVLAVSLTSHALGKTATCSSNTCTMMYFSLEVSLYVRNLVYISYPKSNQNLLL